MDVRKGDRVVVVGKYGHRREFVVSYADGDYDFSVSPAKKSITMLNGTCDNGEPVVWRQDSDGGRIVSVNGQEA